MSRISYFQRFSQKENHATNNVLLILRRFYDESPFKIERVFSSLLDEKIEIGLAFTQQIKGASSVPDALVSQPPLRIFFETKRGGELDADQIKRHIDTIAEDHVESQTDILIGLTKEPIARSDFHDLKAMANRKGVLFAAVTFSQILDALGDECAEYERDLIAIVEDFEQYLAEENLLEERSHILPVFACGTSYAENERFGLYYESPIRPCKRNHRFIGIYSEKRVSLIGEVEAIAIAEFVDGELTFTTEAGKLTDTHQDRIRKVIEETGYYDLDADPHRYYLMKNFVETDIHKTSSGGIRGIRYLDLRNLLPDINNSADRDIRDIAERLKGTEFE